MKKIVILLSIVTVGLAALNINTEMKIKELAKKIEISEKKLIQLKKDRDEG